MKHMISAMAVAALGLTMAWGAEQNPAQPKAQGQAPHAWGDKDHDGKCDMSGQPVGQGRQGMGGGMGMRGGQGMAGGMRGGMRGGMGMMSQRTSRGRQCGGQCCRQGCGSGMGQKPTPEPEKK